MHKHDSYYQDDRVIFLIALCASRVDVAVPIIDWLRSVSDLLAYARRVDTVGGVGEGIDVEAESFAWLGLLPRCSHACLRFPGFG